MTIKDSKSVFIDPQAEVADDVVIYPDNHIIGKCVIGKGSVLMPGNIIEDCVIGEGCTITKSVLKQSQIGDNTAVGPFSYLRPGSQIGKGCRIGDFVEVKNATIEDNSKASHLSYIGDAHVGKDVNIGCGVVFVNYDGKNKFKSIVKDGAFIGSNSNLVAPVTVEEKGYIATGSTITEDVPQGSLAVARERQVIKEGWVAKKEERDNNK